MTARDLQLTVVIASVDCARTIAPSVRAALASCKSISAQIIIADASIDGSADIASSAFPDVTILREPPGTLVPVLWAHGMALARGEIIALSIGQCVVEPGWASALLAAIAGGAAGAGGALQLDRRASATDGAVFLLRYASFTRASVPAARAVPDIAGDNAAYRHDLLAAHADSWRDGFWEIDFHRRLDPANGDLLLIPGAVATFRSRARLSTYLKQRLEHGKHFGGWRVGARRDQRVRLILAAPLVPFVLMGRIARRAGAAGMLRTFLTSLPQLFLLASAWALGELLGALRARDADSFPTGAVGASRAVAAE